MGTELIRNRMTEIKGAGTPSARSSSNKLLLRPVKCANDAGERSTGGMTGTFGLGVVWFMVYGAIGLLGSCL
jgi:hypothetical protein